MPAPRPSTRSRIPSAAYETMYRDELRSTRNGNPFPASVRPGAAGGDGRGQRAHVRGAQVKGPEMGGEIKELETEETKEPKIKELSTKDPEIKESETKAPEIKEPEIKKTRD